MSVTTATSGGEGSKNVAVAATPEQLSASSVACMAVTITARAGNTKPIAYGFSNAVRATAGGEVGAQLSPGASVSFNVSNLNKVWLDAQVGGQGVSFTFYRAGVE